MVCRNIFKALSIPNQKSWGADIFFCGGTSRWRVCYQRGLPRLVFTKWWSLSGEGLLSTGPTQYSLYRCHHTTNVSDVHRIIEIAYLKHKLYIVQSAVPTVYFISYILQHKVKQIQSVLYSVQCTLYTVHCILYIVYSTTQTVQFQSVVQTA